MELRRCAIKSRCEGVADREGYFHGFTSTSNNDYYKPCFLFEDLKGNCSLQYDINSLKFVDRKE